MTQKLQEAEEKKRQELIEIKTKEQARLLAKQ